MAKAEKLPSGNWRVRVQYYDELGNRHHKSVLGKTEAEALYLAEKEQKKLQVYKPEDYDLTLSAAAEKFINTHLKTLSPSTVKGYRQMSKNYFPALYNTTIGRIDNKAIQRAVNADSTHSPKSLMNAVGFVSVVLKEYRPDFVMSVKMPKKQRDVRPIPTLEEVGVILNACEGSNVEIAVNLAIYLGMRLSEVAGVKFEDVKNGKIFIHSVIVSSENGYVEINTTKNTNSTRVVNLPEPLIKLIEEAKKTATDPHIVPMTPGGIYKAFQRVLAEKGLPRYRFHDLRHCNASIMLRLNIPTKYQMARGGWATDSTLKTVYQHTMADHQTEVDNQLYSFIDKLKNDVKM